MEPLSRAYFPKTTLTLCTGSQGSAHWKHRGVWHNYRIRPGSLFIGRGDAEMQTSWTSNGWPRIVLQLDNDRLQHIAPDQVNAIESSLVSALTTVDLRVNALMLAMRDEVREGCPSGRLFSESVSLVLLAYLAGTYATPKYANHCGATLSPAQKRDIADYIHANLTSNISVSDLAELVQMSPSHFARAFKISFGVTPYRFVMRERIAGAKGMLASTKLSSSQVSMAFGFASQSHFVKVFRQFTGVTPKQYKSGF